jgi:DHA2 family multidrug resistance protein-like MFS transporter
VLSLVWGISELATNGYSQLRVGALGLGVVLAIALVLYQTRMSDPMIDLSLFKYRGFGPVLLLSMTAFFCVIGFGLFSTQYLLDVIHLSPLIAGCWMLVTPVLTGAMAPTAAQLVNKVKPAYVIAGAMLAAAAGFAIMTQLTTARQLWLVIPGIALIGAGTSTTLVLLTDVVVTVAPPERTGATTALQRTFQELGGASGIAIFGSIGAAIYASRLDHLLPSAKALPGKVHDTFGATLATANAMPGGKGGALSDAARQAFTHSLNIGAEIGLGVAVVAAVFAVARLSHLSYATKEQPQAQPQGGGKGSPVPQGS